MKSKLVIALLGLFFVFNANASSQVGQCLFPKSKVAANGYLQFSKPVFLYAAPNKSSAKQLMTSMATFSVVAEAHGGWVQLASVPGDNATDSQASAGKVVGWGRLKDFDYQDLRNCNL